MTKRIKDRLALLLLACLCLSALCPPAAAAAGEAVGEGTLDVSAYALQFGGFPVQTAIAPDRAAKGGPTLEQVLVAGLNERKSSIDLTLFDIPVEELGTRFWTVVNRHPELFFVNNSVGYYHAGGIVTSVQPTYNEAYTQEDSKQFVAAAEEILAGIESDWDDARKALYLHDALIVRCEYDLTLERHNAHDALVVRSAVCQGYALAYGYLCRAAGIETKYVTSKEINHAWNLVTLGKEDFYVDCTWDDPTNGWSEAHCRHDNFLRDQAGIYSTNHASTDWLCEGESLYNNHTVSSAYEGAWWENVWTPVAQSGEMGAYARYNDASCVYLRQMDKGTESAVPVSITGAGSSAWWGYNFSTFTCKDGTFYFTLPSTICTLSPKGETEKFYTLTAQEQSDSGYLFGLVNDGGELWYSLGKKPYDTTFTRAKLHTTHDLVHHDAKAPTCTAAGWAAYDTCAQCDYTTYTEIAALGHDLVHHAAQAPTATAAGWQEYDTCTRCDYTTYVEIPAVGAVSGDLNGDGNINIKDAVLIMRHIAGGYGVDLGEGADLNHDGSANIKDAVLLMRYVAGGYGVTLD